MASQREAVRRAQALLVSETAQSLIIDGVWGPRTDGAYLRAPIITQSHVGKSLENDGFTINAIRARYVNGGRWLAEYAVLSLADRASDVVGLRRSYLRMLLALEPVRRQGKDGTEYDCECLSPSRQYRGLFQVGALAWEDARAVVPELGSYEANWRDPYLNAIAAAAFARRNMGYAKQLYGYTRDLSDQALYALHNQGHSFIKSAKMGGNGYYFSSQSVAAQKLLLAASSEIHKGFA